MSALVDLRSTVESSSSQWCIRVNLDILIYHVEEATAVLVLLAGREQGPDQPCLPTFLQRNDICVSTGSRADRLQHQLAKSTEARVGSDGIRRIYRG